MKIRPAPAIASLAGSAGEATISSSKGVPYVKQRMTPANPQTHPQQQQRAHAARQGPWWRSWWPALHDFLDLLAFPEHISGYNLSARINIKALAKSEPPPIVPLNKHVTPVASLTATPGLPSTVTITLYTGNANPNAYAALFSCPADPNEPAKTQPDLWTQQATAKISLIPPIPLSVGFPYPDKLYYLLILVGDSHASFPAATNFSGGIVAQSKSGA